MVNFGETLKTLRTNLGMTQTELAKRLGITKSVVSYYELQERTPSPDVLIRLAEIVTTDTLNKLCIFLKCQPENILEFQEETES